jgi:hypothetical protein
LERKTSEGLLLLSADSGGSTSERYRRGNILMTSVLLFFHRYRRLKTGNAFQDKTKVDWVSLQFELASAPLTDSGEQGRLP